MYRVFCLTAGNLHYFWRVLLVGEAPAGTGTGALTEADVLAWLASPTTNALLLVSPMLVSRHCNSWG